MNLKNNIIKILIIIGIFIILILIWNNFLCDQQKLFILNFIKEYADTLIAFTAIILTLIFWIHTKKYNQNKLFSELITEYSKESIGNGIRDITDFTRDINCYIDKEKDNDDDKVYKKILFIDEYRKLKKEKKREIKKNDRINDYYCWKKLDNQRRIIVNYFVKIGLFLKKHLITDNLFETFWNEKSLSFLIDYIFLLDYVAIPLIMNLEIEKDFDFLLVQYYNKQFTKKKKFDDDKKKLILYFKIIREI